MVFRSLAFLYAFFGTENPICIGTFAGSGIGFQIASNGCANDRLAPENRASNSRFCFNRSVLLNRLSASIASSKGGRTEMEILFIAILNEKVDCRRH